jgi:hypothetical protein
MMFPLNCTSGRPSYFIRFNLHVLLDVEWEIRWVKEVEEGMRRKVGLKAGRTHCSSDEKVERRKVVLSSEVPYIASGLWFLERSGFL